MTAATGTAATATLYGNGSTNTYSGGTIINNGVVQLGDGVDVGSENVSALGTGLVTINTGGTLSLSPGITHECVQYRQQYHPQRRHLARGRWRAAYRHRRECHRDRRGQRRDDQCEQRHRGPGRVHRRPAQRLWLARHRRRHGGQGRARQQRRQLQRHPDQRRQPADREHLPRHLQRARPGERLRDQQRRGPDLRPNGDLGHLRLPRRQRRLRLEQHRRLGGRRRADGGRQWRHHDLHGCHQQQSHRQQVDQDRRGATGPECGQHVHRRPHRLARDRRDQQRGRLQQRSRGCPDAG